MAFETSFQMEVNYFILHWTETGKLKEVDKWVLCELIYRSLDEWKLPQKLLQNDKKISTSKTVEI